jgi:hypothetical protein
LEIHEPLGKYGMSRSARHRLTLTDTAAVSTDTTPSAVCGDSQRKCWGRPLGKHADGECWPLVAGTEVELVRTAGSYPDVVCVRVPGEQSCAWTFRLGIEPVATYDREQAETKGILDHFNEVFDRTHPECKDYRTNPNLPEYCY